MKAEFKIGDKVTYKPYDSAHKGRVRGIKKGMWENGKAIDGTPDDRIFYNVTGETCLTWTTGKSIVESKLFTEDADID